MLKLPLKINYIKFMLANLNLRPLKLEIIWLKIKVRALEHIVKFGNGHISDASTMIFLQLDSHFNQICNQYSKCKQHYYDHQQTLKLWNTFQGRSLLTHDNVKHNRQEN